MQAVLDLRRLVDQITETYAGLANDEEGPNPAFNRAEPEVEGEAISAGRSFQSNVKVLQKTESTVLSESIPVRRKGVSTGLT